MGPDSFLTRPEQWLHRSDPARGGIYGSQANWELCILVELCKLIMTQNQQNKIVNVQ